MKSESREGSSDLEMSEGESEGSLFVKEEEPESDEGKRWKFSPPPEEDFSEYSGTDWGYQIIGEEVDSNQDVFYEVQWDDWYRKDGTNTTWATNDTSYIDASAWKRAIKGPRRTQANVSLEVDLAIPSTDIHNTETVLLEEAYKEKLKRYKSQQGAEDIFLDMANALAKHQEHHTIQRSSTVLDNQGTSSSPLRTRASQRTSARQQTEGSSTGSSTSTWRKVSKSSTQTPAPVSVASSSKAPASFSSSTHSSTVARQQTESSSTGSSASTWRKVSKSSTQAPAPAPVSVASSSKAPASFSSSTHSSTVTAPRQLPLLPKGGPSPKRTKRIVLSDSDGPLSSAPSTPPQSPSQITHKTLDPRSQRKALGEAWSALAKKEGAAPIYFVNDFDDDPTPLLDPSFVYIERSYQFTRGVEKPSPDFLISCSCSNLCSTASHCECQTQLEVAETQPPAYLPSGLYSFAWPDDLEIVECNKFCSCSAGKCTNRVSQEPRRIPIEIFKTKGRGWGVRSSMNVVKGQVLGLYTGLVMTRFDAMHLPEQEHRFDLDHSDTARSEHELFSVDSRLHGNWTRFINHSCSPNVIIYTVVHDIPPNSGLPFIVFVAVVDIPAHQEFTFDYNPNDALAYHTKGKMKKKPKGTITCYCGSDHCRGYVASAK